MEGDTDDDELTFVRLAAVTADVVRFLKEKQTTQRNERAGEKKEDECSDQQSRRYVEHRVRELREFERRTRGE